MRNRADLEVEQHPSARLPERVLVDAVLCRALLDTGMYGGHVSGFNRRLAVDYILSDDESPFTFVWCARHRYCSSGSANRFISRSRKHLKQFIQDGRVRLSNPKRSPGRSAR